MKVKLVIIVLGLVHFLNASVNAQNWERRDVGFFDELKVSGHLSVELIQSETYYVEIENRSCCLTDINIEEKGDVLRINYDKGLIKDDQISVRVYTSEVRSIKILAGAEISNNEPLTTKSFELLAWSGASAELMIYAERIDVRAHSGAEVDLAGDATELIIKAHSGAIVDLEDLRTKEADVLAATGAQVSLWTTESLGAKAGTGAVITFNGNPTRLNINQNLGGVICKSSAQPMN